MSSLVMGVGVNDRKYPVWAEGKVLKEYHLWYNLLARCYCPKYQRKHPTYIGCQADENFKNYSYFHQWCQHQVGFGEKDFELDKDLIFKGNKLYSKDTCLFLPRELNGLLPSCKTVRGVLPIGVSFHMGRFRASSHTGSSSRYLGHFNTPDEAFAAYKQAKETYIKTQAEKWKALIDPRAYAALMAYEVLPTD